MKEDFFKTKDGQSFQVFYLKNDEPNKGGPADMWAEYEKTCGGGQCLSDLNEMDVNENSAGGGAHANLCAPSVHINKSGAHCCPVGEEGESGETGLEPSVLYEEELVIKGVLDSLSESQINMASETARVFLAKEIAKDLRDAGMLPYCPF